MTLQNDEIQNEKDSEEIVKEIKLEENNQNNNEITPVNESVNKSIKIVEKKPVSKLTDDERALIMKNYSEGIDQPYFDVKQFKNGNFKIIKKKPKNPSISEKVINSTKNEEEVEEKPSKIYYSDNQLLFEHIIELNQKIDKLMTKQKKLKKKYQTLQNDIYVDDSDEITEINDTRDESEFDPPKVTPKRPNLSPQKIQTRSTRYNWRSQLTYL